jgi:molecular chaperone HtpG
MMKAMGQIVPSQKRILELNPDHPVIQALWEEFRKDKTSQKLHNMILYVYEQAILLEWWELEDYRWFINRLNTFIK